MFFYSAADENRYSNFTVSNIYAHDEAEDFMQHDILLTEEKIVPESGVHKVTLCNPQGESREAIMFVWRSNHKPTCGLVVLSTDADSLIHCCMQYAHGYKYEPFMGNAFAKPDTN